ncbi:MAG: hypothetical protein JNM39_04495 [Bdellovibrionaceae bacterium]|nr:hypothetical protein [Pseudobdellovibrionaceae bacterium]
MIRRGSFYLVNQGSGIKVDIVIDKETEFYKSEFSRRKKLEVAPGIEVFIASPEDLILKKLDYYREGQSEKHLLDIRDILANVKVDDVYLSEWVERLNLRVEWEKA